jgi:hypothetical protein
MVQLVDLNVNDDDLDKRGPGNLWFGPRLGKRDYQTNDIITNPDTMHTKDSVLNVEDTGSSYFIVVPASTFYSRGVEGIRLLRNPKLVNGLFTYSQTI